MLDGLSFFKFYSVLFYSLSWSVSSHVEWYVFVLVCLKACWMVCLCPGLSQSMLDGLSLFLFVSRYVGWFVFVVICLKVCWSVFVVVSLNMCMLDSVFSPWSLSHGVLGGRLM